MQTALARELSAFVWEVMRIVTPLADGTRAIITPRQERASENQATTRKKKSPRLHLEDEVKRKRRSNSHPKQRTTPPHRPSFTP